MLIIKVKICGITNYKDAAASIDMGADLIGFNFYPKSLRYITPEKVKKILDRLPAFVDIVGVFVNESVEQTKQIMDFCSLDWIQLHGDESPEFCDQFISHNVKVMKALRIKEKTDIEMADSYFTDAVLLDAFHPEQYGGTGKTFDWNIMGHIGKRVFLAGGINADNAPAAAELGVYGIDVCSGVESKHGKKDHKKMKKLFENIKYFRG
jgi:phosphoribosylanthranilate isomerase